MKVSIFVLAIITAGLQFPSVARADDAGVGSTPSGGLEFVKNASIEMLSEDLSIAVNKIRVDYIFRNNASSDITMKIGFPLPVRPDHLDDLEFAFRLPHDQDFKVWVDAKPVSPDMITRLGRFDGPFDSREWVDLTDEINQLNKGPDALAPSKDRIAKFRALNLLCSSRDSPDNEFPCWEIKTVYVWEMTFPAHRDVSIRHEFKPWKGSFPDVTDAMDGYCPDKSFKDAVEKARSSGHLEEANVDFILKTASNWFGPIKSFALRIDKQGAALVSLCPIPGLVLLRSGNSFIAKAKDFVPKSDISIYFLGHGISNATKYEMDRQLHSRNGPISQ